MGGEAASQTRWARGLAGGGEVMPLTDYQAIKREWLEALDSVQPIAREFFGLVR